MLDPEALHEPGDGLADRLVVAPVGLLVLLAEVTHLQREMVTGWEESGSGHS